MTYACWCLWGRYGGKYGPGGSLVLSYGWEEDSGDQAGQAMGLLSTALVPNSCQLLWDGKMKEK